jgi:hypothetical protein
MTVSFLEANYPNPVIGGFPYAHAQGVLMGFAMKVQLYEIVGNGDCLFLAICAAIFFQLKDKNEEILRRHLTPTGAVTSPELVNLNFISGIGERIVNCHTSSNKSGVSCARQLREHLADHYERNEAKFREHFTESPDDDGTSSRTRSKSGNSPLVKKWVKYIKTAGNYWVDALSVILQDLLPSVTVLILYSEKTVSADSPSGTLRFFDGPYNELISSNRDKGLRIVLHMINPGLTAHLSVHEAHLPEHGHNLRRAKRSRPSDANHYEPVQLDVDPRFHFPGMDEALLEKLTGDSRTMG